MRRNGKTPIAKVDCLIFLIGYINAQDLEVIFPKLTEKMTESEKAKFIELSLLTTKERTELESSKANVIFYTWMKEIKRSKGQSDIGKK